MPQIFKKYKPKVYNLILFIIVIQSLIMKILSFLCQSSPSLSPLQNNQVLCFFPLWTNSFSSRTLYKRNPTFCTFYVLKCKPSCNIVFWDSFILFIIFLLVTDCSWVIFSSLSIFLLLDIWAVSILSIMSKLI